MMIRRKKSGKTSKNTQNNGSEEKYAYQTKNTHYEILENDLERIKKRKYTRKQEETETDKEEKD